MDFIYHRYSAEEKDVKNSSLDFVGGRAKSSFDLPPGVSSRRLVGGRIRLARKQRGLTQKDLANSLGVSFQQINKYETGKNEVPVVVIDKLSQLFSVPHAWFFESLDRNRHRVKILDFETSGQKIPLEEIKSLVDNFRAIKSADHRRALLRFCRALSAAEKADEKR